MPPGADAGLVVRGDLERREFVAFRTVGGRVAAGMAVDVWDTVDAVQDLVRAGLNGAVADPDRLRDPDVPLAGLA